MNKSEAFELWEKMNGLNWNAEMVQDIQDEVDAGICELHKTLTGKKCSDSGKAYRKLVKDGFQDDIDKFVAPYRAESIARMNNLDAEKKTIESELIAWAKENPVMPDPEQEPVMIKKSYGGSYHTQGWGANKYAKNSLMDDYNLLNILGYNAEIKAVEGYGSEGSYPQYYENYELWANITEFDFWCLTHSGSFISVLNWCVDLWRNGSNPKVYFPFLSDDDYDKSQYLAYKTNYEVTKENMKLELSWDEIYKLYPLKP